MILSSMVDLRVRGGIVPAHTGRLDKVASWVTVHPLGKPPLDVPLQRVGGLSPADHSLITCAHHLGGQVLTNDKRLISQCTAEGVGCKPFLEFLEECEQNGWLSSQTVEGLRRLCGA